MPGSSATWRTPLETTALILLGALGVQHRRRDRRRGVPPGAERLAEADVPRVQRGQHLARGGPCDRGRARCSRCACPSRPTPTGPRRSGLALLGAAVLGAVIALARVDRLHRRASAGRPGFRRPLVAGEDREHHAVARRRGGRRRGRLARPAAGRASSRRPCGPPRHRPVAYDRRARRPGWAADPYGRHQWRYWDGNRWTEQVADGSTQSTDPAQ